MDTFLHWWQHLPEQMNPVLFQIGEFRIQYYGLMYLVAFTLTYILSLWRIRHEKQRFQMNSETLLNLTTALVLGLVIGARLGYVVFYNFSYYLDHPLEIILPFQFSDGFHFTGITGMSYHGGLIGTVIAMIIFARSNKLDFFHATDLIVPCIPLGYTFGRIGNFINGELYGRVTELSIGMYFPFSPGLERRHPSQLYEAFFEGIVLFGVLWAIKGRVKTTGAMLAFYLMGYGLVRFFIEYTREPDAHLGFVFLSFSMGQVLCMAMILSGGLLLGFFWRQQRVSGKQTS
ncbi:prolipoprotein diacylglyceryl transferase [Desulfosarcina sp. OttesenSCG-928-A07]|nr:prolipoprotein diacylglyceryl transferase [Desulfosarcina sp. OttesenSCG-928-A07]